MSQNPAVSTTDQNQVFLTGSLTRDAELRYTQNGKAVCNFQLGVRRGESRTFINCVAWEDLAEKVSALRNPPTRNRLRLRVTGRLACRSWEHNGEKRTTFEVIVSQLAVEGDEGAFVNDHGLEVSDADIAF